MPAIATLFDPEGRILVAGKRVMTREKLAERIEIGHSVLCRWDCSCPIFEGDPLGGSYLCLPGFKHAMAYSEEIVNRLEAKLAEIRAGRFTDKEGTAWLSSERSLLELLPPNASKRRKRSFYHKLKYYWRRHGTKLLKGTEDNPKPKVEARLFAFGLMGDPRLWFRETQILEIKNSLLRKASARAEERDHPPRWQRRAMDNWYTNDGVFDEPAGKRFSISKAATESGISKGRLWQYVKGFPKELKEALKHIFPDGFLPSDRRLVPGSKKQYADTVLERDLRLLKNGIKQIIEAQPPRHYKTSEEICDAYRIDRITDRIKIRRFLTSQYAENKLRGRKACRPGNGRRGWSKPMLFDTIHLSEILVGRDLLSLAREALADKPTCATPSLFNSDDGAETRAEINCETDQVHVAETTTCQQRKRKRGPKGNKKLTLEIQEFCYVEFRIKNRKRVLVFREAVERFRGRKGAPKRESHVTEYARRYAVKYGYPVEPNEAERTSLLLRWEQGKLRPERFAEICDP